MRLEDDMVIRVNEQRDYAVIDKYIKGQLTRREAAIALDLSERSVTNRANKVRKFGLRGMYHGNRFKEPANKMPTQKVHSILELFDSKYFDFSVTHFCELLKSDENIDIKYPTLYGIMRKKNKVNRKKRRRNKKHFIRERSHTAGLMIQFDGSPHQWNGEENWCLIGGIDDATDEFVGLEFFKTETTLNCLKVLKEILVTKGIPLVIYTDKAGWSRGRKRQEFSHFKAACDTLGITIIATSSPEAKGRIERAWGTLQGRVPQLLRLKGIKTMEEANKFLKEEFMPGTWNKKWLEVPASSESSYQPIDTILDLDAIICTKEYREIKKNHTASIDGFLYKVISNTKESVAKLPLEIRTQPDGSVGYFVHNRKVDIKKLPNKMQAHHKQAQEEELLLAG